MVTRRALLWFVAVIGATASLGAQDLPDFTGRLQSSWTWSDPGQDVQTLGLVKGWAGLSAGTSAVKTELRAGFVSAPSPALSLDRAWVKFRLPRVRVTTGLGRVAWGPGLVLVPGDLLFESTSSPLDFEADELRSTGAWLADAWWSWADESFLELAALENAAGGRVSAAPGGMTLEAASVWDQSSRTLKNALSTQFHWGLDWYAVARQDAAVDDPRWSREQSQAGAGVFALTSWGGVTVASRHEAAVRGSDSFPWQAYDDVSATRGAWTGIVRSLYDSAASPRWSPSAELRWSGLQDLTLFASTALASPWWLQAGCSARY